MTQKLPKNTAKHATFPIQKLKITVEICGNVWVRKIVGLLFPSFYTSGSGSNYVCGSGPRDPKECGSGSTDPKECGSDLIRIHITAEMNDNHGPFFGNILLISTIPSCK